MKKDKAEKDLDVGALLIGMDEPELEEGEEGDGAEETEDANPADVAREAMSGLKAALAGDDLDAQVSAFRTAMQAVNMYDEE